jgi:hypothetical protein
VRPRNLYYEQKRTYRLSEVPFFALLEEFAVSFVGTACPFKRCTMVTQRVFSLQKYVQKRRNCTCLKSKEQNSAVYYIYHRAISYAPAGFNNYSKTKVQKCSFTI